MRNLCGGVSEVLWLPIYCRSVRNRFTRRLQGAVHALVTPQQQSGAEDVELYFTTSLYAEEFTVRVCGRSVV